MAHDSHSLSIWCVLNFCLGTMDLKSEEKKKVKVTEWWASELPCIAAWILNYITLGTAVTLTTEWMVPSGVVLYGSVGGFPFLWDLNILVYKKELDWNYSSKSDFFIS